MCKLIVPVTVDAIMLYRRRVHTLIVLLSIIIACSSLQAQQATRTEINADLVLVIDGRKHFPILLSPGPPTNGVTPAGVDGLAELHSAGALFFRMAQTTNWDSQVIANQQAALDWAYQHSMYCMVNLRELSTFAAGDTAKESSLRNVVSTFKSHPALALWKNKDEAWWGDVSVDNLRRGYEVIREEDPYHPVEQTHAPRGTIADLQPYNAAADILALDIYPVSVPPGIHSLEPNNEISMVGDWTQFLMEVSAGQKPCWMIEQIAWSGVTPPAHPLVFPTYAQSRYMAFQAIANGARGLMFFGGNIAATLNTQDAALGWNWTFWNDVLKPVVQQIGAYSPLADALVAPPSTLPVTMSGTILPDVEYCVREANGFLYIIACKREGQSANVVFSGLPDWAMEAEVLYESPRLLKIMQGGRLADSFAPFDVHVYRIAHHYRSADFDHDDDVDQEDFGHLQVCLTGAGRAITNPACFDTDLDNDTAGDAGPGDVGVFLSLLTGPAAE